MKKSQQPALFIWVLILLVWGLFSACSLQNNALPNLPPDNAQANSSPLSEKDQFLACLPQIRALTGSYTGPIPMETHHPCHQPEEIESVQYYFSPLKGSGNTIRSKVTTPPYKANNTWINGGYYFSETHLKSGAILRSKNNILNPYDDDLNEQKFSPIFKQMNYQCLPKVEVKNDNQDSFSLSLSLPCVPEDQISYVYYSIAYAFLVDITNKISEFNDEKSDNVFGRIGYAKIDLPPFQKTFLKCTDYSGYTWYISPQIKLKSGEYLTTAPIKIDFPKREGCPPPPDGQAGSGK